jgi:ribosome assembly protein YihI (activator of Der GTPase)
LGKSKKLLKAKPLFLLRKASWKNEKAKTKSELYRERKRERKRKGTNPNLQDPKANTNPSL